MGPPYQWTADGSHLLACNIALQLVTLRNTFEFERVVSPSQLAHVAVISEISPLLFFSVQFGFGIQIRVVGIWRYSTPAPTAKEEHQRSYKADYRRDANADANLAAGR